MSKFDIVGVIVAVIVIVSSFMFVTGLVRWVEQDSAKDIGGWVKTFQENTK